MQSDPFTPSRPQGPLAWAPWGSVFAALMALRVAVIHLGNIKTDAYITWRCAHNLLATGVYGYNLGEKVSASTSHLAVLLSGLCMLVAGQAFIPLYLFLNSLAVVAGLWLLARLLLGPTPRAIWLWACLGLLPAGIEAGTLGLETGWLVLAVALVLGDAFEPGGKRWALGALFLLPWIRPDAVAFGILAVAWVWARERRFPWAQGLAVGIGAATLCAFNALYFGQILQQTIIGKSTCYDPGHDPATLLAGLRQVFVGTGVQAGVTAPFTAGIFIRFRGLWALSVLGAFVGALVSARRQGRPWGPLGLLGLCFLLPTAAYAFGGILLFPWYFIASKLCLYAVLLGAVVAAPLGRRGTLVLAVGLAGFLALGLAHFLVHSLQDQRLEGFYEMIGRDLSVKVKPDETLMTEIAGTVPYFAGCYTYDSVGLATPSVVEAIRRDRAGWYESYLKARRPTYVLQEKAGLPVDCGARWDAAGTAWFNAHYRLEQHYHYQAQPVLPEPWAGLWRHLSVQALDGSGDWFLYRRV